MSEKTGFSIRCWRGLWILCFAWLAPVATGAESPAALVERLNNYAHAVTVSGSQSQVQDHEIGLGAMRKSRGAWQFKSSERVSGTLRRDTWQIVDGFTSLEVFTELVTELEGLEGSALLFSCEGRSCGQGVQWANRVFGERILYGREELQHYRVYSLVGPTTHRVVLYCSARTADRQYLHMESLELLSSPEAGPVL